MGCLWSAEATERAQREAAITRAESRMDAQLAWGGVTDTSGVSRISRAFTWLHPQLKEMLSSPTSAPSRKFLGVHHAGPTDLEEENYLIEVVYSSTADDELTPDERDTINGWIPEGFKWNLRWNVPRYGETEEC